MKYYGAMTSALLFFGLTSFNVPAADTQLDISLGCVAVATKDVAIKTGDCGVRRVESVERVEIVESSHHHHKHGKHNRSVQGNHNPGKGHKTKYIIVPAHRH